VRHRGTEFDIEEGPPSWWHWIIRPGAGRDLVGETKFRSREALSPPASKKSITGSREAARGKRLRRTNRRNPGEGNKRIKRTPKGYGGPARQAMPQWRPRLGSRSNAIGARQKPVSRSTAFADRKTPPIWKLEASLEYRACRKGALRTAGAHDPTDAGAAAGDLCLVHPDDER
jgi:hypothetical protein